MDLNLKDKGNLVEGLWHSVDNAANNLEAVPRSVKRVIETQAWRKRIYRGRLFEHATFLDFITTKPLAGCGWPPDKVEALLKDEPSVLQLWREATKLGQGKRTDLVDNINEVKPSKGTSRAYTLDRLKRERRDLFDRVCAGELTANAAAIEAGFRKLPTPLEIALKQLPKLTPAERGEVRAKLDELEPPT
jgi:hypothetical protein